MATFTALYDACVLYPAPLRDLLLELAVTDLFRAKWSSHIHDEWIRAVLEDRPDLTTSQLRRTRDLMDDHARDCLVEDFEELIPSLTLPDPNDRHVLAAAIRGRADVIVTYNLRTFPTRNSRDTASRPNIPMSFCYTSSIWPRASSVPLPEHIGRGSNFLQKPRPNTSRRLNVSP